MNSHIPPFDQDDEDFDWDAAVQEIDAACQSNAATTTTTPTTSNPFLTPPPPPAVGPISNGWNNQLNKPQNNSRQLTLDKFITNPNRVSNPKPCLQINEQGEQIRVPESSCYVEIDPEAAKTWIYPDNVARREYQFAISKTALFSNTLVALPTGLGKTLIAAVVMYNYFRWFPEGKIVFAAPSRPLVMQQIEACHNIVGIPQEWTIDMTGQTSPPKRASLWQSKRVFFVTPQVFEKDIQSGACLVKYLVCLVIDEAHRAMGNYSYCVAVRELMAVPVELRILALTATPGSKQQTIQQVIDNLQISTLEYRSEDDVDVCPYVHNRKIELIEVPMGKDAIEINNLLLEAIRPLAARLCTMGVLQNRDFQTLSPCELLNSREKFRQAPPPDLSSVKYSEVEGYFGVLITLYHIRKLLSSHGIRPAHEMLEEKLRQGYFARLMSRNEAIMKANLLMQKSLSHGAPSPKLSKMIDVLVDHFGNYDPQNSRVIIFSNFRGSVRDILDSMANIGHSIKATQFIGQSSGKTLKGQTQKIQQAVLEKFREGGYNVIVATSIGEEGLDIMEVDLVICFDANISPLRMIQRMGRTGRKNDGRVVVLACEGTEMKGYKRKLATGKTVRKHMQNGGMNSFSFHCSPRMVPHVYKPELQLVKLSIDKFVRQTKKVRNDFPEASKHREKLSGAESELLNKYFQPFKEPCKLSLIAFPHFQAFPSGVHRVKHSARSGWLIDAMQNLQGLSSSTTSKILSFDFSRSRCLSAGGIDHDNENQTEQLDPDCPAGSQTDLFYSDAPSCGISVDKEQRILESTCSVRQIVAPVAAISPENKQNAPHPSFRHEHKGHPAGGYQFSIDGDVAETATDDAAIFHTPTYDENCPKENVVPETIYAIESESPAIRPSKLDLDVSDLSPRLTSYIESGFVPESPLYDNDKEVGFNKKGVDDAECRSNDAKNENLFLHQSPARRCGNSLRSAKEDINADADAAAQTRENAPSLIVDNMNSPLEGPAEGSCDIGGNSESPCIQNFRTPLRDITNSSCSDDWRISSGEKSGPSGSFKLKRLRRIGELTKTRPRHCVKKVSACPSADVPSTVARPIIIRQGRVNKPFEDARDFIDEEAEVSSEGIVPDSEDESTYEDSDAYEDSFIDDQVDATVGSSQATNASSQAEDSKLDMMAIYRRSLLTQSPFQEEQNHSTAVDKRYVPSVTTVDESGECSGKASTVQTPQGCPKSNNSARKSVCSRFNHVTFEAIPSSSNRLLVKSSTIGSRKRKLNPNTPFKLPAKNLEREFSTHSVPAVKDIKPSYQANVTDASWPGFSDDQFYEGIDLDELEAQAAKLVRQRTEPSMQGRTISESSIKDVTLLSAPSFDLGI